MRVRYTENWNYFSIEGTHSLMYYEEKNFDRREDAEIIFMTFPVADPILLKDTANLATRFIEERLPALQKNEKYKDGNPHLDIGREMIEKMSGKYWHKIKVDLSVTDNIRGRIDGSITYYFHYSKTSINIVATNYYLPRINTVETEMPCILNAIEFKK